MIINQQKIQTCILALAVFCSFQSEKIWIVDQLVTQKVPQNKAKVIFAFSSKLLHVLEVF